MMAAPNMLGPDLLHLLLERIEQVSGIRIQSAQHHLLFRALDHLQRQQSEPLDVDGLVQHLLSVPDAVLLRDLIEQLTIHETYFFRGEHQIQQLRKQILPELCKRPYPVRLWSAGCSTGEEAYTLSILLKMEFGLQDALVLATDLHPEAIQKARQGRYREWSFRATPDPIRQQCFTHVGSCWTIRSFLKQHVHFGTLNLKHQPWNPEFQNPALKLRQLDLIVCRNVTLYFGRESAQQVYTQFARLLAQGGMLMLGPTDPQPEPSTGLYPHRHPLGWLWKTECPEERADAVQPVTRFSMRSAGPLKLRKNAGPQSPLLISGLAAPAESESPEEHPTPNPSPRFPDNLEGLRQHVFLHPEDTLALFQLAQAWIRAGEPRRALPLLNSIRRLLADHSPEEPLTPDLRVQELLTATHYTLAQMKGLT